MAGVICTLCFLGLVGFFIGMLRGHPIGGFVFGFFLGPIGWILVALADSRPKCRYCRSAIPKRAMICCVCGSRLR
jgi:hypothetical protein